MIIIVYFIFEKFNQDKKKLPFRGMHQNKKCIITILATQINLIYLDNCLLYIIGKIKWSHKKTCRKLWREKKCHLGCIHIFIIYLIYFIHVDFGLFYIIEKINKTMQKNVSIWECIRCPCSKTNKFVMKKKLHLGCVECIRFPSSKKKILY